MRIQTVSRLVVVGALIIGLWALTGCTTMGEVKDVSVPPHGFNPELRRVCHTQSTVVVTDLPASFLQNKAKIILLVKLYSVSQLSGDVVRANWGPVSPSLTVNDKATFYLMPKQFEAMQIKSVAIDPSYLNPGINTIKISEGWKGIYECASSCCSIGVGLAFQDDPSIPFI